MEIGTMRRLACAMAVLLALAQPVAAERVVAGSGGGQVAVPDRIERVFAAGPPASVLLYVLMPDRIGWPHVPRPASSAGSAAAPHSIRSPWSGHSSVFPANSILCGGSG